MSRSERILANGQRFTEAAFGFFERVTPPEHAGKTGQTDRIIGMGSSQDPLPNGQRSPEEVLGRNSVALEVSEFAEHAQAEGEVGMLAADDLVLQVQELANLLLRSAVLSLG